MRVAAILRRLRELEAVTADLQKAGKFLFLLAFVCVRACVCVRTCKFVFILVVENLNKTEGDRTKHENFPSTCPNLTVVLL